jgi:hypothetical protein
MSKVSQDLDPPSNLAAQLCEAAADEPEHEFPRSSQMKSERLEIARLTCQLIKLKAERGTSKEKPVQISCEGLFGK